MDSTKKYEKPSPEAAANIFSKLFYCWTLPFFKFGYRNNLKIKDIYNTTKSDSSGLLGDELERNWLREIQNAKEKENTSPSLQSAIFKTFYKRYSILGILQLFHSMVIRLLQPVLLAMYIKYHESSDKKNEKEGWWIGSSVVVVAALNVIISHYINLNCFRTGMRVRIACCSLIYRKLLRLSHQSLGQTAAGQLVNLLSNDVQRFDNASTYLHFVWIMPLHFALSYYIMYTSVGIAATAGMLMIAIQAIPIQGSLSRLQGRLRYKIALRTDHRIKLMSEITSSIQVIKLYAWEKPFQKVVELARKLEIDVITKTSYIKGMSTGMMVFTERFILYLTLITYVLLGNRLTGDIVFSLAQLFNIVQHYVAFMFPNAIATYSEAKVSIQRIEQFLLLEENTSKLEEVKEGKAGTVELIQVDASWKQFVPILRNLNLFIQPGTLCCIVGNIGSGKSSLLQLLIKELPASEGCVKIFGKVAYASQEPWLFVSSVRNNVIFGKEYFRARYKEVIKVCSLETDLDQLPYGDKTTVGERGAALSGGQKARINLARAVYSEADIYLMDDPLSAVDTHVARHLFEECIVKYLSGKTRILVTHQLQFLKQADLVVFMNDGKIEEIAKFDQLSDDKKMYLNKQVVQTERKPLTSVQLRNRKISVTSYASSIHDEGAKEDDELIEKGAISASTYIEYWRAGTSLAVLIFLVILLIIAQMASNACDLWLRHWTNVEEELLVGNDTDTLYPDPRDNKLYIMIYTIFIIASIILTSSRSILYYKVCMNTSKALHNKMFSCILNAPMKFFNTNPSGRILNRFSKDMGAIDELLPVAALDAIQIFLVLCGILLLVFIVTPFMILPALLLAMLFYFCRTVYLSTAQDIKRLEGITRAPVFSHTSASLEGLSTIRSSDTENMLIKEFDTLQDRHTSTWFLFLACSETFGFYLDVISTMFLALVTYQFLIFNESTLSGNVGLVVSQTLVLTGMLQFGVRQTAEVASNMISVERILQYTKLEDENQWDLGTKKNPGESWATSGNITFRKMYLNYVEDQMPVLKNLNFEIKEKEKIGIVGRTGAGKSSLIASLFRLAPIDGTIFVDSVDISTIELQTLRSKISIIPQEPVLFSASIRYNLDPFETQEDDILWKALENVELKNSIKDLDQEVSEGGSNFSTGQKQLMCLARAIVKNNKILVMDEATANVDTDTDALIQKTIKEKFKDCTVLTIAHRLNTIMDSDKVLVMDSGRAVEFDHPHVLLQKPNGFLTKMVRKTGDNMELILRKIAEEDFLLKNEHTIKNDI